MTDTTAGEGDLDLYDDKVQAGISWTMRQWGEALGLTTWTQGDGSESVEGDVGAEIHTILVDAGLRDPETNDMATLAAQPSAGAQGEAVGVDRDWMIKVIRERSLPQDAADMIIGAMRFAATPAQPDTGDVAALRSILARYPSIRLHAALNKLAALSKPNAPGREG